MANRFYVSVSGGDVQGPFEVDDIKARVASGEYGPATQVCPEGTEAWSLLGAAPEFGGAPAPDAPRPLSGPPMSAPPAATAIGPAAGYVAPVLVTIFCCLIGGIVSLVYTAKANTARAGGDQSEYDSAMKNRNGWMIASLVIAVLVICAQVVLMIAAGP